VSPAEYYSQRPLHRINADGSVTTEGPAAAAPAAAPAAAHDSNGHAAGAGDGVTALAAVERGPTALAPLPDRVPVTFVVPSYVTQ
jgi:hypothetical protein